MSYQGSDNYGLWRAVSKQVDLRVDQYDGKAREGELVVDSNPGPNQYQLYIGTSGGNLVPVSGGGGNVPYANTANVANVANVANSVAGANVLGPVLDANHANVADVANSVAGANVVGQVADSAHADVADTADNLDAAGAANVRVGGGTAGQVLKSDGLGGMVWATDDSAPAPPDMSIQFNKGGAFDGDPSFIFDASVLMVTAPNVTVTGESNLGPVANVKITGGTSGQVLTTDGSGGLSWATAGGTPWQIANGTSDLSFAAVNGALTGNLTGVRAFNIDGGAANYQIAIGSEAGHPNQEYAAIAIGPYAAGSAASQKVGAIAIGEEAGYSGQQSNAIAIGFGAGIGGGGSPAQGQDSVAIGNSAGAQGQGNRAISIGHLAGKTTQGANSIAIGAGAGVNSQPANSIIINATGANLDSTTAGSLVIAPVRADATNTAQALYYNTTTKEVTYNAVTEPWRIANGNSNVSLAIAAGPITGYSNGKASLHIDASVNLNIAIGANAGLTAQDYAAIAIGVTAGRDTQASQAIAIGEEAGFRNQGVGAIAIGTAAGVGATVGQAGNAIAIGRNAGAEGQGANAIAIGSYAGQNNQGANSIIINATGALLNSTTADSLTISPIRNDLANTAQALYYNTTTKEVTYAPAGGGGGSPAGANTEVQFNDSGAFGAQSTFTFDKATDTVTVKDFDVTGNVLGSLLPDANITHDLGSSTQRWKDLWLSNTSIHLGDQIISANSTHVILNDLGSGNITSSGNVSGTNFIGNLANGITRIEMPVADGNIDVTVGGVTQWTVSTQGKLVIASPEGNITGNSTQTLDISAGIMTLATVDNSADAGSVNAFTIRGGNGGNGAVGSGEGGDIALIAGRSGNATSGTAAEGGSIQFTTGAGGDGEDGGNAGNVELITNNGGDGSVNNGGAGGSFNITLGDGGEGIGFGGAGANMSVFAGDGGNCASGIGGGGGWFIVNAGNGGATTNGATARGGNISITAGTGGATSSGTAGAGGLITITAGAGGLDGSGERTGSGGGIELLSGIGTSSGEVTIGSAPGITPTTGSGGWTGTVTLAVGNAGDSNNTNGGRGGTLNLRAGNGGNSLAGGAGQRGGTVNVVAGNGGYGEDGARGGNLIFTAGHAGYSTNDDGYDGGRVAITAGNGSHSTSGGDSGSGGAVTITSGSSQTADGQSPGAENAGTITLQGGVGSPGGRINIYAGQGIQSDGTTAPGAGGSIYITAGSAGVNAITNPGSGGSVNITAGDSTGPTGIGGSINLRPAQGPDSWGNVRIDIDNPGGTIEDAWRFSKDTTTYLNNSPRLHFPQWRNSAQSISGAITTVPKVPIANQNLATPGILDLYTASSAEVWSVKLLVYVSHDTYVPGSEVTEIMEYLIARNGDGSLRVQRVSYLSSDPVYTASIATSASITGTTMTVDMMDPFSNSFKVGQIISGLGVSPGTTIVSVDTGGGGVGTYTVNQAQTVPAGTQISTSTVQSSVSASINGDGVIVAVVNVIVGNNIEIHYTATEFLLGTV